jgi:hypothetical protein
MHHFPHPTTHLRTTRMRNRRNGVTIGRYRITTFVFIIDIPVVDVPCPMVTLFFSGPSRWLRITRITVEVGINITMTIAILCPDRAVEGREWFCVSRLHLDLLMLYAAAVDRYIEIGPVIVVERIPLAIGEDLPIEDRE